jgi:hypothetical protein
LSLLCSTKELLKLKQWCDRATTVKEKRQKIEEMKGKGAGIVEGDLIKPETLMRACAENLSKLPAHPSTLNYS